MPPDDDDQTQDPSTGAPAGDDAAVSAPATVPPAALAVHDTPEYKELLKQNRKLARQFGDAKAAEAAARAAAEAARLSAEETQQAAMEQQIADILGEQGVAEWNAIHELSGTNPVEAAKRLAALMQEQRAQSPADAPAAATAGAATTTTTGEPAVTQPSAARGVDADAPLSTQPGSEMSQLIGSLEQNWTDTVKRNQNASTRGRVTMKDRAAALISYLGASYLKSGATPKKQG